MCGRFTLRTPLSLLIKQFDLDASAEQQLMLFGPRYNIAPTQEVLVVRNDPVANRRGARRLRWGLIPSWSKEPPSGPPMINARSETLAEKPTFRTAYRCRRCLIPADGFYEWQQRASGASGKKQPFYIRRPDEQPFAFAGLWESWTQRTGSGQANAAETGEGSAQANQSPLVLESCTIVTTAANATLRPLHDRMPVILASSDYDLWLDAAVQEPAKLQHMLAPCGDHELVAAPVSTHVNRVANDDPRCVAPERSLFD